MDSFLRELLGKRELVSRAYELAKRAHQGEQRKNGEPYLEHCLATARLLAQWQAGDAAVAAGLLHDAVDRPAGGLEAIRSAAGEEVAGLVAHASRADAVRYRGIEKDREAVRHLVLYLASDIRALLIRLASRHHNLQSLYVFPDSEQRRIALETMDVWAPIAQQLGMRRLRGELEDLAFPYIYPREHRWLMAEIRERREALERRLAARAPELAASLAAEGIAGARIEFRAKHYASLYRKLLRYEMDLGRVHDLIALRVITRAAPDCYAALGVVHRLWPPLAGRLKDYIAAPKPNGYRSIHTIVRMPEGHAAEVQIRTDRMHEEAEFGIAAHFAYIQGKRVPARAQGAANARAARASAEEIAILRDLYEWRAAITRSSTPPPSTAMLFAGKVLALTPRGDVVELPAGATAVDFAYHIHTDLGDRATGARVNGAEAPLDRVLGTGDTVEILTAGRAQPSAGWLRFARTARARERVRGALRKVRRALSVRRAREPGGTEIALAVEDRPGIAAQARARCAALGVGVRSVRFAAAGILRRRSTLLLTARLLRPAEGERVRAALAELAGVSQVTVRNRS